jgi:hypothetical protein
MKNVKEAGKSHLPFTVDPGIAMLKKKLRQHNEMYTEECEKNPHGSLLLSHISSFIAAISAQLYASAIDADYLDD